MESTVSTGNKARPMYATWIRNLAVAATALGLAGAVLTGTALVDEPQPASATLMMEVVIDSAAAPKK